VQGVGVAERGLGLKSGGSGWLRGETIEEMMENIKEPIEAFSGI